MLNHSKQQQSVILKGIAQQLLTMQMPTFAEIGKLLNDFDLHLETTKDKLHDEVFQHLALAQGDEMSYFCFTFEVPNGAFVDHIEEMSWKTRSPEQIERLIHMFYNSDRRATTTDAAYAKTWSNGSFKE